MDSPKLRVGKDASQTLDGAVTALEDEKMDDINLKSRYAALLRILVARLHRSLLSSYSDSAMPFANGEVNAASNMDRMAEPAFDIPDVQDSTSDFRCDNLANMNLDDRLSLPLDR